MVLKPHSLKPPKPAFETVYSGSPTYENASWPQPREQGTNAQTLDRRHLYLRLLAERDGEVDPRTVVSSYSARGSACCLRLWFARTLLRLYGYGH